jgi:hypothetical protein
MKVSIGAVALHGKYREFSAKISSVESTNWKTISKSYEYQCRIQRRAQNRSHNILSMQEVRRRERGRGSAKQISKYTRKGASVAQKEQREHQQG